MIGGSGGIAPKPGPTGPVGSGAGPRADDQRLRKACADFEAVFMSQIFAQLRATVPHDGLLDGGQGEDMFTSMMDEHIAGAAAARLEHGVGAALYQQLRLRLNPETK